MFDRGILFSQEYGKPSNKSSKYQNQPDIQSMEHEDSKFMFS